MKNSDAVTPNDIIDEIEKEVSEGGTAIALHALIAQLRQSLAPVEGAGIAGRIERWATKAGFFGACTNGACPQCDEFRDILSALRSLPPAAAKAECVVLPEAMMAWSKAWELDGDLCRCRLCNRAIIVSRSDEAFRHAADCPQSHLIAPWQDLRSRIPANERK